MPFVFVHGVNNRLDPEKKYQRAVEERDYALQRIVAPLIGIQSSHGVHTPYWGDKGVHFWHDLAVLPGEGHKTVNSLAADDEKSEPLPSLVQAIEDGIIGEGVAFDVLIERAPEVAIDVLFDSLASEVQSSEEAKELLDAYVNAQSALADTKSNDSSAPAFDLFLGAVLGSDGGLKLQGSSATPKSRTINRLQEGVMRLQKGIPSLLSRGAVKWKRGPLSRTATTFLGDAFQYLVERGNGEQPGPIAQVVMNSIAEAHKVAKDTKEPLVIISHSFGGEIVYDILTHYAKSKEWKVDAWITVGSQVGLFEEMSMLWASPGRGNRSNAPKAPIEAPPNVIRWLNVVDKVDVLSFLVEPVFKGAGDNLVLDITYDTGLSVLESHSGYFRWPSFYRFLVKNLTP